MSRTTQGFISASAAALCIALVGVLSTVANAASISYGNFGPVPPGVTFNDVKEDSGTDTPPLYGPPTAFATGLDFDPSAFVATATSGDADVTDGQLNFTISAGAAILNVSLFEAGDYSLLGAGTAATQVFAGAILRASVTQVNGVDVAPIPLTASNAQVGFDLLGDSGVVQPWSLGTSLNVAAQLPAGQNATKVEVVINNQLVALSEPGSIAFIAKKDFVIETEVVPEPTTMALAGLALCGLGLAARKRS